MSKDFLELNRPLRMGIYGFWNNFEKYLPNFPVYGLFESICPVEITKNYDECDVVLCSVFNNHTSKPSFLENTLTMQYVAEPKMYHPDNKRWSEYEIGFMPDDSDHFQHPIWYNDFITYSDRQLKVDETPRPLIQKTKYCAVYASHDCYGIRTSLFNLVNPIQRVDSYGSWRNNMPQDCRDNETDISRANNKYKILDQYKFNICAENSIEPYYTTEKLAQAMIPNTIPIYVGDPLLHHSPFNMKRMLYGNDMSQSDFVQALIHCETHFDEIIKEPMLTRPLFPDGISKRSEKLFNRIMEELS